ncbi:hypothetical protein SCL_0537 [Sulfuricaulis limicola]|uniref:Uncharacterized protein n=1 Tax=Sulfuricaulis limicola TaxID=1620215 RepID=A0A1B4XDH1_9GAMM|nr:hypothetical protein SCL_0537 [Sulfuricaulis limicola]
MREDVTVDPLQNELAVAIDGHDKGIVDQPVTMRADGAYFCVRKKLAGNDLLKGHAGKVNVIDRSDD